MNKTVTDPVCGVVIEPMKAAANSTYEEQTYYFCSQECKETFDKDPQKYAEKARQPEHRR